MYDKATKKYNSDYEHVLWAAAGHPLLERRSADIFKYYVYTYDIPLTVTAFEAGLRRL